MPKVLVTEPLAPEGLDLLRTACEVVVKLKPTADELRELVADCDALIVRSATQVTADVLQAGARLMVVGRAGTGVDNIDLDAATRRGITVVNAPAANTVAVAEHTLALMLCMARHICQADSAMHAGKWQKQGLMGVELRDKTLGLVGLGRVGSAVAARAVGFEMHVLAYDPFISPDKAAQMQVELAPLDRVLAESDFISLHAPLTERTRSLIGADELALVKPNAYLINCARGELVDVDALVRALRERRLAGAALDVFAQEPCVNPELCDCPNLLLTPHLGASTEEAQASAAVQVAREVLDVLQNRPPRYPVNTAALSSEELAFIRPYVDLAMRLGKFYARFAENNLTHLELTYAGDVIRHDTSLITAAALAGLLAEAVQEPVNLVNAPVIAREHGLVVNEVRTSEAGDFTDLITLRARTTTREHVLAGTVMRGQPHIVRVDDYWLDFVADGSLLVTEHVEQPGIIGQMGTFLGNAGVSISFVQVGRQARGGQGLMVMGLDDALNDGLLAQMMTLPSIRSARVVSL